MTRYFLHMTNGQDRIEDLEGAEFANLAAARQEAIASARQIMSARVLQGQPANGSRFEIADESGRILLVVSFKEAIS